MSDKQIRAHSNNRQIKTHVKTACESHNLNMEFRSFDNGFKQLLVRNLMQEYKVKHSYTNKAQQQSQGGYITHWVKLGTTLKPVLSGHSKNDKSKTLMTNGSLMKDESIAECSPWSILQYF